MVEIFRRFQEPFLVLFIIIYNRNIEEIRIIPSGLTKLGWILGLGLVKKYKSNNMGGNQQEKFILKQFTKLVRLNIKWDIYEYNRQTS